MSKVISGGALIEAVKSGKYMEDGTAANCDGIKYDFRLDSYFLKANYGAPIDYSALSAEERKDAVISPGEVVFVVTKETLALPHNIFLQLSPKRKMTEFGIMTLGGFAVDPGYKGKLMFGLYNISSVDFRLLPGNKLVGAVFHQLEEDEIVKGYQPPKPVDGFSPNLIEKIKKYNPVGINTLEDSIRAIESQIETMKSSLYKNSTDIEALGDLAHKNNKQIERITDNISDLSETFKKELSDLARKNHDEIHRVTNNIDKLSEALKEESEARKNVEKDVTEKIAALKGALWLATALGGAVAAIFIGYLTGLIKFS